MKKSISKKQIIFGVVIVVVLLLIGAIAIPYMGSVKRQKQYAVEQAVDRIFSAYEMDDRTVDRAKDAMADIIGNEKQQVEFEKQAVAEIKTMNGSSGAIALTVYDMVVQQKLLEAVGYESAVIKRAYEEQILALFELQDGLMEFDDFVEDILEEPLSVRQEKIYHMPPTYYTSPQEVFADTYLPAQLGQKKADVLRTKDTGKILNLCGDLAVLSQYDELSAQSVVSVQEMLTLLTTDAETIIVKESVGGYYDGREDDSSANHLRDEELSNVGSLTQATVSSVKYFGDLASYYFHRSDSYFGQDENGNNMQVMGESISRTTVYLRGVKISNYDLEERFIKYAYEDGMTSYHKDSYCFAISDTQLVCFVGKDCFALDL